jgi:hypothetical protein
VVRIARELQLQLPQLPQALSEGIVNDAHVLDWIELWQPLWEPPDQLLRREVNKTI